MEAVGVGLLVVVVVVDRVSFLRLKKISDLVCGSLGVDGRGLLFWRMLW